MELDLPDAKVCATLCVGGAVTYTDKPENGVSQDWILQHVAPNIVERFGNTVGLVLGRALLWCVFSVHHDMVPLFIQNRIHSAYDVLPNTLADGENPINKKLIVVTGNAENDVRITVLNDAAMEAAAADGAGGNPLGGAGTERELLLAVLSVCTQNQTQMANLQIQREHDRGQTRQEYRRLSQAMNRVANRPDIRLQAAANAGQNQQADAAAGVPGAISVNARLSRTPRSLELLWQEYTVDIGGRKPARDFNAQERGKEKHNYCRRKVLWDLIGGLIRAGDTVQTACDRIRHVYGADVSITNLTIRYKKDKRDGTLHASLRL